MSEKIKSIQLRIAKIDRIISAIVEGRKVAKNPEFLIEFLEFIKTSLEMSLEENIEEDVEEEVLAF